MPRRRRQFYAWFDQRHQDFRLSLYPPDAPVRPSTGFASKSDVMALAARKYGEVLWLPPLTKAQESIIATTEAVW